MDEASPEMEKPAEEQDSSSSETTMPLQSEQPAEQPFKRRWLSAENIGIVLGTLPYLFALNLFYILKPIRHSLLSTQESRNIFFGIMIGVGLLALVGVACSLRALLRNDATSPYYKSRRRRAIVGLFMFIASLFMPINTGMILSGLVSHISKPDRHEKKVDRTTNDLGELYYNFSQFAEKRPDKTFPSLSHQPGKLMHDAEELKDNSDPSPYIAENDPDYRRMYDDLEILHKDPGYTVDDWSYFYLGYEITTEEAFLAFAQRYKEVYSQGKWLEGDVTVTTSKGDEVIPRMNIRPPIMTPDMKRPPLPGKRGGTIPVLIERLDNNRGKKAHVLFLDGHVEFMPYPGRWPMTEKTMALLNELDQITVQGGAK